MIAAAHWTLENYATIALCGVGVVTSAVSLVISHRTIKENKQARRDRGWGWDRRR